MAGTYMKLDERGRKINHSFLPGTDRRKLRLMSSWLIPLHFLHPLSSSSSSFLSGAFLMGFLRSWLCTVLAWDWFLFCFLQSGDQEGCRGDLWTVLNRTSKIVQNLSRWTNSDRKWYLAAEICTGNAAFPALDYWGGWQMSFYVEFSLQHRFSQATAGIVLILLN